MVFVNPVRSRATLYAYVVQDGDDYHFVTPDEDGSEMERKSTQDTEEILYWVLADAANRAALGSFAIAGSCRQISRTEWFEKEVQILGRISSEWQKRRRIELAEIQKRSEQ